MPPSVASDLCLIWVCSLCLCPIKRMLGLYGLNTALIDSLIEHPYK